MRPPIEGSGILVTGGAGFIGSHLVDRLFLEGAREVVVIDNMFLGSEENLEKAAQFGVKIYREDAESMASLEAILEEHPADIVFNCATKALANSFTDPASTYMVNPQVAINLLELQRIGRFTTLVHFSTSEVYGSAVSEPMDEEHPIRPTTAYAAGKVAADVAAQSYAQMFGLDSIIVRPFNNYGPRQNWREPMAAVIPRSIHRLLDGQRPVIHGEGMQSRDFIYVLDTIDAVVGVYERLAPGDSVNICAEGQMTIRSVIEAICRLMKVAPDFEFQKRRHSDVECHRGSTTKLRRMGTYHETEFEIGLKATVDWYVDRLGSKKAMHP